MQRGRRYLDRELKHMKAGQCRSKKTNVKLQMKTHNTYYYEKPTIKQLDKKKMN